MISSPQAAVLWGSLAGVASGWLSRQALKKAIASPDRVFYSVFFGGILARLAVLAAAIWTLRREIYIIIILFTSCMVLAQMFFEVIPVKHGTKRDT